MTEQSKNSEIWYRRWDLETGEYIGDIKCEVYEKLIRYENIRYERFTPPEMPERSEDPGWWIVRFKSTDEIFFRFLDDQGSVFYDNKKFCGEYSQYDFLEKIDSKWIK